MKTYYWLFATPLLASPECCSSEQDLYDEANHLLTVHNKKGHVASDFDSDSSSSNLLSVAINLIKEVKSCKKDKSVRAILRSEMREQKQGD